MSKWRIKESPFEVINMDHGCLDYEIVDGYVILAALYSDPESPEALKMSLADELYKALLQMMHCHRDAHDKEGEVAFANAKILIDQIHDSERRMSVLLEEAGK